MSKACRLIGYLVTLLFIVERILHFIRNGWGNILEKKERITYTPSPQSAIRHIPFNRKPLGYLSDELELPEVVDSGWFWLCPADVRSLELGCVVVDVEVSEELEVVWLWDWVREDWLVVFGSVVVEVPVDVWFRDDLGAVSSDVLGWRIPGSSTEGCLWGVVFCGAGTGCTGVGMITLISGGWEVAGDGGLAGVVLWVCSVVRSMIVVSRLGCWGVAGATTRSGVGDSSRWLR